MADTWDGRPDDEEDEEPVLDIRPVSDVEALGHVHVIGEPTETPDQPRTPVGRPVVPTTLTAAGVVATVVAAVLPWSGGRGLAGIRGLAAGQPWLVWLLLAVVAAVLLGVVALVRPGRRVRWWGAAAAVLGAGLSGWAVGALPAASPMGVGAVAGRCRAGRAGRRAGGRRAGQKRAAVALATGGRRRGRGGRRAGGRRYRRCRAGRRAQRGRDDGGGPAAGTDRHRTIHSGHQAVGQDRSGLRRGRLGRAGRRGATARRDHDGRRVRAGPAHRRGTLAPLRTGLDRAGGRAERGRHDGTGGRRHRDRHHGGRLRRGVRHRALAAAAGREHQLHRARYGPGRGRRQLRGAVRHR